MGSSPLTRGKLSSASLWTGRWRLIPAHAGKTNRLSGRFAVRRAHPRSRGENSGREFASGYAEGSSPLTRGKQQNADRLTCPPGLIPAHAGKTPSSASSASLWRAHPRSRGENLIGNIGVALGTGSSPLTRGKLERFARVTARGGLIPAHAGKTRGRLRCGVCVWGSSPLTRGKRPCPTRRPAP